MSPNTTTNGTDLFTFAQSLNWSMALVAGFQFPAVFLYILYFEIYKANRPFTVNNVMTPVNTLLLVGTFSLTGLYIVNAININLHPTELLVPILSTLMSFFLACVELCYVYYTMERSRRILEISYHQNLDQFHKILDPLPVVYFLQVIPSILPLIITDSSTLHICKIIRSILLAFSGLMTLIIDTVFLASFAKYLHLSAIGGVLDHRYEITSHYGIASCLCCYLVLILYVTGTSMGAPESDMGEVLVTVSSIFLDLVLVISFLLKISLNQIGFDDHPSSDTESCLEGEKGVAGVKWIHHVSVPTPSQRDARISDDGRISRVFYQLE